MAVPLKYNLRSLRVRWRSTIATTLGVALVVAVFVMVMSLHRGMQSTYIRTGDERNLLVLRKGSTAESSSQISREEARRIKYTPGISRDAEDQPLASAEIIVLILLDRLDGGSANVQVRGLGPVGLVLRPSVRIVEGRMFESGKRECIVSRKIADRFANCRVGETFHSGKDDWHVAGIFDAQKSAYESEIWVDADEARDVFKRRFYGSVLFRPLDTSLPRMMVEREDGLRILKWYEPEPGKRVGLLTRFLTWWRKRELEWLRARVVELESEISRSLAARIKNDRMLQVAVQPESLYYREQTKSAGLFQFLASFLAVIMSIGAAFSAMNTMYAAVGARTREIGTLRVLGFKRREIYASILLESVLLTLLGGALGCLLSLPMNGLATGTMSQTTFAEIAFEFRITPELLGKGMVFASVMGVVGGLLPARLAARKPVLDALRAV